MREYISLDNQTKTTDTTKNREGYNIKSNSELGSDKYGFKEIKMDDKLKAISYSEQEVFHLSEYKTSTPKVKIISLRVKE